MNGIFFLIRNWKVPQRKIEQLTYCHPKLKRRTSASIYLSPGRWCIYSRTSTASGNFSEFSPLTSSFQFSMGATDKGRAAAPAAILNERTPSKTSSTREIVCLTCYYFCQLWGSQSNIGSQDLTRAGMFLLMWFYGVL